MSSRKKLSGSSALTVHGDGWLKLPPLCACGEPMREDQEMCAWCLARLTVYGNLLHMRQSGVSGKKRPGGA